MASLQTDGRRCSLDSRNDETWFPTDVYNLFFCTDSMSPSQRELRHAPQHLPVSYLAGWRRGSTCWGWHQEMWLVIHQDKNNCRDYTSAAEREAICIFPIRLPMDFMKFRGICFSLSFSVLCQIKFCLARGLKFTKWQAGRETGG